MPAGKFTLAKIPDKFKQLTAQNSTFSVFSGGQRNT